MPAGRRPSPPSRADALADIVLPDHECHDVRLGDLWSDRPAALVWLRHYGWIFCKQHAVQLDGARGDFKAAGVNLMLIGQGTPRQAAEFRRRQGIQLPVLADHDRVSYNAAGTRVGGVTDLFNPQTVAKGLLATARTKRTQTRTIGHPAQLGGTLVIMPDGSVAWAHMAQDASDNAPPEEILAASRVAAA